MPSLSKLVVIVASSLCLGALASSDALAKPKKQKQRAPASTSQHMQSRGTAPSEYERIRRDDSWMFRKGGSGGY